MSTYDIEEILKKDTQKYASLQSMKKTKRSLLESGFTPRQGIHNPNQHPLTTAITPNGS